MTNDRVTYNGGTRASPLLNGKLNLNDYFTDIMGSERNMGLNSGVYKILGFENGGFTAIRYSIQRDL
ncbi:hypothetical protein MASR2M70_13560 [Bacillota bacterium]